MSWAGAWVSRPPGQAKASQQATRPAMAGAGHRAALDHTTGQAVATSSRTRSTPQRRLIRGRGLALARTQPLALAIGHRTHAKGRQATAKGSAAPPIRGQRGALFAAISGAVRSRPLAGHRIPHQGKQQSTGGTVQARGQPHRQHRPKTSKPLAGRCSLEQNTKTGHKRQLFGQARQNQRRQRAKAGEKKGRIYVNE